MTDQTAVVMVTIVMVKVVLVIMILIVVTAMVLTIVTLILMPTMIPSMIPMNLPLMSCATVMDARTQLPIHITITTMMSVPRAVVKAVVHLLDAWLIQ